MSNHYKANKQTYYLNLRSGDATITQTPAGNNYKFEWLIKNIDVSKRARMCVSSCFQQSVVIQNGNVQINDVDVGKPIVFRCPQVQSLNIYDSTGSTGSIIHISNNIHTPVIENWYPLNQGSLNRIELYVSNVIIGNNNGITDDIHFLIQLKIEDYDTEPIDPKLMPTYTRDSLSFHYGLNVK